MKIIALTLGFCLFATFSFSQIKKKDLVGNWFTSNDDGMFHKADTIKFYPKINSCIQTKWIIEKRTFKTNEIKTCTEPPRISGIINKEKYFFVKGRIKEIIIKGGINISPAAVEDALLKNFSEILFLVEFQTLML